MNLAETSFLTELKGQKMAELSSLDHEINVLMLSNAEVGAQIKEHQTKISEASAEFEQ